jgi:hypothetical protein
MTGFGPSPLRLSTFARNFLNPIFFYALFASFAVKSSDSESLLYFAPQIGNHTGSTTI